MERIKVKKKINHAKKSDIVAVLAVLNKTKAEEIVADFLVSLTGLEKKRVSNVLSHLFKEDQIMRVRQGVYRLRQDPFVEEGVSDSTCDDTDSPSYLRAKRRLEEMDKAPVKVNYEYVKK
jgi:predicted transcriptional regulator of viral defense system